VGKPAPALVVPELDGNVFDLAAQRGKVVIVNVWASWCPPCRAEMPALDAFYRAHHGQGIEMIGLSADDRHERDQVLKAMQTVHYPVAMASDAKANGFGPAKVLPMTYVIDTDGIVRVRLGPDEAPLTEKRLAETALPLLRPRDGGLIGP
jgi:thiol-disulfide isomerase/thioredoxin